jgi:ubiquinone/menaquinone biosynthesis C-methylase UbiE
MIKRTSLLYINSFLSKKKTWKILDLGCGYTANKNANYIADVTDFSEFYTGRKFTKILGKILPFKDNFFDFVIASHVIEHVKDIDFFIKELQRVAPRGYIELPTRLEDNLLLHRNNIKEHLWLFYFDDNKKILIADKKKQNIEPFITMGVLQKELRNAFRESLVLELYWEKNIEYKKQISKGNKNLKKLYFLTIVKKYVSYHLRKNKLTSLVFLLFLATFLLLQISRN